MDNSKTTIILVEDDERTIEELTRILKKHTNMEIIPTSLPSEAIRIAKEQKLDIALLDLKLPEMSGLELVSCLKETNPDILITIMTGYGEEETPVIAKEKGVVDFIEKPLNLPYLLATLRFQEREANIRKTLRSAADLLQRFFSMTEDGVVMTNDSMVIVSNPLGIELYEKFKECGSKKIKHNNKQYEYLVSQSGGLVFHHFKDITSAFEISKSETQIEMAKMVAHELHNSLTPIKLWLQEILSLDPKDEGFPDTAKKAASEGILQIDRLTNLTRKFKEISKEKISKIENIKIAPVISKLISSLEPMIKAKSIILNVELNEDLSARASEQELHQVLYNLTLNSIEAFSQKGGTLSIKTEESDFVVIKICDNAGGLPPQVEANPFSPYMTTKENGTGLGLVLSKEITTKMGGELSLKNIKGVGVEAEVKLPKATNVLSAQS